MKLRFTRKALSELDAIIDYIEARSPQAANRVKARIAALAAFIEERPHGGQRTSEDGLRRVVATPYPYVLFYEVKEGEDAVVVVGVRHGARRPDPPTRDE